jgi:long-chain acyl-CoA synthetase
MSESLLNDVLVFVFMFFARIIVTTYTYATLPVYYLWQKPWKRLSVAANCGGKPTDPSDPHSEWTREVAIPQHPLMSCQTVSEAIDKVMELYPSDKPSIGYREVLAEEVQVDGEGRPIKIDGKVLRKYRLSDYRWLTLGEVSQRIDRIAKGLMHCGCKRGDRVAIYAETGVQWFLMSGGIAKVGAVLVTLFHTLNDEGLIHALNETEVSFLITSFELITRVSALSPKLPALRTVVYFEGKALMCC